jgi:predicted TIM-barrel fold metal-dependent hydrolase
MMTKHSRFLSATLALTLWFPLRSMGQGTPPPGVDGGGGDGGGAIELPQTVLDEISRCGSPFDAHLHLEAQWFSADNAQPLLAEMTASGIDQGIIMAVYGPIDAIGVDPNEGVTSFVQQSNGRLFGLASLNTTAPDWETAKEAELARMTTYLEMDGFVAVKLAPPHTRLAMNSTVMGDILEVISKSSKPIVAIHVGTSKCNVDYRDYQWKRGTNLFSPLAAPFCGPFGDFILGQRGLCTQEYVDPYFLEDYIATYSNVTFVMMHGGQDFDDGTSGDIPFYNGELFDHTLDLMGEYDNLVLEISAMLALNPSPDTSYRNPLAFENLLKVVDAGMQFRTLYGSDSNQFPGGMTTYLISTVDSLIDAGFTEEERCWILVDFPKQVYNIPNMTDSIPPAGTAMPSGSDSEPSAPTSAPTSTGYMTHTHFGWLFLSILAMTA